VLRIIAILLASYNAFRLLRRVLEKTTGKSRERGAWSLTYYWGVFRFAGTLFVIVKSLDGGILEESRNISDMLYI
jgi:hypothetical protein